MKRFYFNMLKKQVIKNGYSLERYKYNGIKEYYIKDNNNDTVIIFYSTNINTLYELHLIDDNTNYNYTNFNDYPLVTISWLIGYLSTI